MRHTGCPQMMQRFSARILIAQSLWRLTPWGFLFGFTTTSVATRLLTINPGSPI